MQLTRIDETFELVNVSLVELHNSALISGSPASDTSDSGSRAHAGVASERDEDRVRCVVQLETPDTGRPFIELASYPLHECQRAEKLTEEVQGFLSKAARHYSRRLSLDIERDGSFWVELAWILFAVLAVAASTCAPAVSRTSIDATDGTVTQTDTSIVPCCVRNLKARPLGAVRGAAVEEVRVLQPAARFDLAALVERRLYRAVLRLELEGNAVAYPGAGAGAGAGAGGEQRHRGRVYSQEAHVGGAGAAHSGRRRHVQSRAASNQRPSEEHRHATPAGALPGPGPGSMGAAGAAAPVVAAEGAFSGNQGNVAEYATGVELRPLPLPASSAAGYDAVVSATAPSGGEAARSSVHAAGAEAAAQPSAAAVHAAAPHSDLRDLVDDAVQQQTDRTYMRQAAAAAAAAAAPRESTLPLGPLVADRAQADRTRASVERYLLRCEETWPGSVRLVPEEQGHGDGDPQQRSVPYAVLAGWAGMQSWSSHRGVAGEELHGQGTDHVVEPGESAEEEGEAAGAGQASSSGDQQCGKPRAFGAAYCVVCYEQRSGTSAGPTVVLLPCRHMCMCEGCAVAAARSGMSSCPVCRAQVVASLTVFA